MSLTAEAYLRAQVPQILAGHPAVRAIAPLADQVWRVETDDGRKIVVKHQLFGRLTQGTAYDLLEVERDVLGFLRAAECPVPAVLGIDQEAHCIFLQWVGDRTLDDAIQDGEQATTIQAIRGLCAIERACAQRADQLAPRVVPSANRAALATAWDEAGTRAHAGIEQLCSRLQQPLDTGMQPLLEAMHGWLAARPAALGSVDYNACNAVVEPGGTRVYFLEFAKIGWDWTERRLTQYTSSMGSGRQDGRMCSLLDAPAARLYAEASGHSDGARALDYHRIFFLLNSAALLCAAPDGEPHAQALRQHWKRPLARLRQCAAMLAQGLSTDPSATEFRSRLQFCLSLRGGTL